MNFADALLIGFFLSISFNAALCVVLYHANLERKMLQETLELLSP